MRTCIFFRHSRHHGPYTRKLTHVSVCVRVYVGSCQNYGPFFCPYYNRAPIIWGTQKGTLILTRTHVYSYWQLLLLGNAMLMAVLSVTSAADLARH